MIAALVARECRSGVCRLSFCLGLAAFVILVGLSRLALGVHYPSDVVAGALAGGAWASIGILVAGRRRSAQNSD